MRDWFKAQKSNIFLWTPLFLAFGMALYFTMFSEPKLYTLIVSLIIGIIGLITLRKFPIAILISCFAIGFGYAGIFTHCKNNNILEHDVHNIEISGIVTNIESAEAKTRIFLASPGFGNIRVSTSDAQNINIGDTISGMGGLFKPHAADMPGGFDFARWAYFNNLNSTGYINDIKITYTADSAVYNQREEIKNKANSFLVNSLVLGYKHDIPTEHREIWTKNGMAHIWSISGYHLTLIAGWLFIVFYFLFRLCPYIVRRVPARIPALICSWVGILGYLFLSGGGVATLRAFIMTTLVMIAFIIGRNAISLRIASIAFIVLALINPYYVISAGFQLSFAAIFGIIWLWSKPDIPTPHNKILKYTYTAVLTALIATIFTTPFVLGHFGTVPLYGILGNLVFLPLFSFILMPVVFIGTICALCGIHAPIRFAHYIYDNMLAIAKHISNLPLAEITIGNISNIAIILFVLGLACLIFIRNQDNFKHIITRHLNIVFAGIFISAGILVCIFTPRPLFYISNDHKLIGAVTDGKLQFNKSHDSGNYFAFDSWKKSNGEKTGTENKRLIKESGIYRVLTPQWNLIYIQNFVPLSENIVSACNDPEIKYIASYFDINSENCAHKIIHGGAVIYESGNIKYTPSNRIWHNRHE